MAAPPEVTITNLSGKYTMNRTLGDDQADFFALQGLSWLTRKAITYASVQLTLKEFEKDGAVHINIDSVAAGVSSTNEYRVLTWDEREHEDKVFGKVKGKSRFFKRGEFQSAIEITEDGKKFLLGEQLKDGSPSAFIGDDFIQSVAVSQGNGWTVDQVWGFEEINGQRRYTRRALCSKDGKFEKIRIVYDYDGPV